MLHRRRPLLDVNDAACAGIAAIWAGGAWPTAARVAQALRRAEDASSERLTGVHWPRDVEELPKSLVTALDRLVRTGELDVVEAPDGSELRFRPGRALVDDWLPLVNRRELRQLETGTDSAYGGAGTRLAAAAAAVRGTVPTEPVDDDELVAMELQLRARRIRLLVERRPATARLMDLHLEEEASLLAQTGQMALARQRWSELGNARLDPRNGLAHAGTQGMLALEEAVLSGDDQLRKGVLTRAVSEDGLNGWGCAWQRTLRGLLLDDTAAVEEGAAELDRLDGRKRKETTDVAVGAAARALMASDSDALHVALERTIAQHLRYLRHGSWRGDASPSRTTMALRVLGSQRGIRLPDELFVQRVTVKLRCCDSWHGEPVHGRRASGSVNLAPMCQD